MDGNGDLVDGDALEREVDERLLSIRKRPEEIEAEQRVARVGPKAARDIVVLSPRQRADEM